VDKHTAARLYMFANKAHGTLKIHAHVIAGYIFVWQPQPGSSLAHVRLQPRWIVACVTLNDGEHCVYAAVLVQMLQRRDATYPKLTARGIVTEDHIHHTCSLCCVRLRFTVQRPVSSRAALATVTQPPARSTHALGACAAVRTGWGVHL